MEESTTGSLVVAIVQDYVYWLVGNFWRFMKSDSEDDGKLSGQVAEVEGKKGSDTHTKTQTQLYNSQQQQGSGQGQGSIFQKIGLTLQGNANYQEQKTSLIRFEGLTYDHGGLVNSHRLSNTARKFLQQLQHSQMFEVFICDSIRKFHNRSLLTEPFDRRIPWYWPTQSILDRPSSVDLNLSRNSSGKTQGSQAYSGRSTQQEINPPIQRQGSNSAVNSVAPHLKKVSTSFYSNTVDWISKAQSQAKQFDLNRPSLEVGNSNKKGAQLPDALSQIRQGMHFVSQKGMKQLSSLQGQIQPSPQHQKTRSSVDSKEASGNSKEAPGELKEASIHTTNQGLKLSPQLSNLISKDETVLSKEQISKKNKRHALMQQLYTQYEVEGSTQPPLPDRSDVLDDGLLSQNILEDTSTKYIVQGYGQQMEQDITEQQLREFEVEKQKIQNNPLFQHDDAVHQRNADEDLKDNNAVISQRSDPYKDQEAQLIVLEQAKNSYQQPGKDTNLQYKQGLLKDNDISWANFEMISDQRLGISQKTGSSDPLKLQNSLRPYTSLRKQSQDDAVNKFSQINTSFKVLESSVCRKRSQSEQNTGWANNWSIQSDSNLLNVQKHV